MRRRLVVTGAAFLLGVIAAGSALADRCGPIRRGQDLRETARQIYPGADVSRDQVMLAYRFLDRRHDDRTTPVADRQPPVAALENR